MALERICQVKAVCISRIPKCRQEELLQYNLESYPLTEQS